MKPGDICLLTKDNALCIIVRQVPHPYGYVHIKMFLVLMSDGNQLRVSQPFLQPIDPEVTCNR